MVDRTLTLYTEDGKEIIADILFTHHSDEFNKDYVVFVVRETNTASAAVYVPSDDGKGALEQIETDEEWALLEELLADYSNGDDEEGGCGGCSGCGGGCGSCGGGCDDGDCNCH